MKLGMHLHAERGADEVLREAPQADTQGFDSVWLGDHLVDTRGQHNAHGPLDSLTLMVAIGAITSRVRLAWGALNVSFRNPALLAKSLASLDVITHGRVICALGAGSYKPEHDAYNIPFLADHDKRITHEREVISLLKELWTHPAPERVTFTGKFVKVHDLPFSPAPYQRPHPPIWIGGESDATLELVRDLGDGWMMLTAGGRLTTLERPKVILGAPSRLVTVIKFANIFVGSTHDEAVADCRAGYGALAATRYGAGGSSFDQFVAEGIVGTPEECCELLDALAAVGINYVRTNFYDAGHQQRVAELLLPRLQTITA
jgi:alkanesulfonate monooxygenase SsuD/methylene tetrahydromethanopterin reductase-like flavin-dependent oxidoreductase (luciferase family)